jgi:hypothetical protein
MSLSKARRLALDSIRLFRGPFATSRSRVGIHLLIPRGGEISNGISKTFRAVRVGSLLSVVGVVGVGGVLGAGVAVAARGHEFAGAFGGEGDGAGQLKEPAGVAVNEGSGDVYVADRGSDL